MIHLAAGQDTSCNWKLMMTSSLEKVTSPVTQNGFSTEGSSNLPLFLTNEHYLSSGPSSDKKLMHVKVGSADIVDLSYDVDEDKNLDDIFEVESDASSDVLILEDNRIRKGVVDIKVSEKLESFKDKSLLTKQGKSITEDATDESLAKSIE